MSLLITGFGPFPPYFINPTEVLVRLLEEKNTLESVQYLVLNTTFQDIEHKQELLFQAENIIAFGLSEQAVGFQVELIAKNQVTLKKPDAGGQFSDSEIIDQNCCDELFCQFNIDAMEGALRNEGLFVEQSRDAGNYLCNYYYFKVLNYAQKNNSPKMVFIHVPMIQELLPIYKVMRPELEFSNSIAIEQLVRGAQIIIDRFANDHI